METQQTSLQDLVPMFGGPMPEALTRVWIRIDLKPERVEEPGAAQAEAGTAFALELAVDQVQPVTLELTQPKVTITLHGLPAVAARVA
jgi:hypothetical protein